MSSITSPSEALGAIPIFIQVADLCSFTAAAHKLGMTASGVSKAITRLEARLGVQLAKRTTRQVSLTEEGALYAERCRQILAELDEVNALVTRRQHAPKGKLRIQLPAAEGRNLIVPVLADFVERYPELNIECELSGRATELTDETVDVAIRIGAQPDSGLIMRKLCDLHYVLCASPSYLDKHGSPGTLSDLSKHRCLTYINPLTRRHSEWRFLKQGNIVAVPICNHFSANGVQALIDAAVAGIGIVYAATAALEHYLDSGQLKTILADHPIPSQPLHILYLPNRHLSPKVRALVDFLTNSISNKAGYSSPLA